MKKIAQEIADPNKAAKYSFEIIKYFRHRIRTVCLTVTDENAAYTLFEALNNRGVDLSSLDLVKNFLFKKGSRLIRCNTKRHAISLGTDDCDAVQCESHELSQSVLDLSSWSNKNKFGF